MSTVPWLVTIVNTYFVCCKTYSAPRKLRKHMKKHNVNLPKRPTGIRRYDNADYSFMKTDCKHPHVETHFGCSSCPTHFSELNDLRDHFINDHSEALPPSSQQENNDSEPHSSRKRSAEDNTNDEDIDTELLDSSCISFVPP